MIINLVYDASVNSAPAGFKTALAAAAQYLDSLIVNPITVNIQVGWGEDGGDPVTGSTLGEGGPSAATAISYSQLKTDLTANATSAADATALANLPATDPTHGGRFFIATSIEKAWGLLPANATGIDGSVGFNATAAFNFDPNNRAVPGQYDFIGVAEHELTHAMGRFAGLQYSPNLYAPLDLFRYASQGTLQLVGGQPAYFSIDGGRTNLNNYDTVSDYIDWASSVSRDSFGYSSPGVANVVTSVDMTELDVMGLTLGTVAPPSALPIMANTDGTATAIVGAASVNATLAPAVNLTIVQLSYAGSLYGFSVNAPTALQPAGSWSISAVLTNGGGANAAEQAIDGSSGAELQFSDKAVFVLNDTATRLAGATLSSAGQLAWAQSDLTSYGDVARLYSAAFNRVPDAGGLNYWLQTYDQQVPVAAGASNAGPTAAQVATAENAIANFFIGSAEFQHLYGPLTDTAFVTQLYANVLSRAPDSGGLAFWLNDLQTQPRSSVLIGFAQSAEDIAKVGVAETQVTGSATTMSGSFASSSAWLLTV